MDSMKDMAGKLPGDGEITEEEIKVGVLPRFLRNEGPNRLG